MKDSDNRCATDLVYRLAQAADLDLSPERLSQLQNTFDEFWTRYVEVRQLDIGDREPPTMSFEREREMHQ